MKGVFNIKFKRLSVLILSLMLLLGLNLEAQASEPVFGTVKHVNPINAKAQPAVEFGKSTSPQGISKSIPTYTSKQAFIDAVHDMLAQRQTNATVHIATSDVNWNDFSNVFSEAIETADDYDQYHYCGAIFNASGYSYTDYDLTLKISYLTTQSQESQVSSKVGKVLASLNLDTMGEHRKVKVIHDWIVKNVRYDESLKEHSAYGGFIKGSTVCQGYSTMLYKMLKESGIENMIVVSDTHAWNLVRLGDKYYHLDATWDDPVPDQGPNSVSYEFYNLTDSQLIAKDNTNDHVWDTRKYPRASTIYHINDLDSLLTEAEYFNWSLVSPESSNAITKSINLPTTGKYGSTITWRSTNPAISNNGTVTRPSNDKATGYLIATFTKGNITEDKYFTTTVLKNESQDTKPPVIDDKKVRSLKVGPKTSLKLKPSQSAELTLTATYTDRTKGDVTELATYSSSSDKILVDDKGVITVTDEAKYKDKATITIKYNGKTTKCKVYVIK